MKITELPSLNRATPSELYKLTYPLLLGSHIYCSGPITSGGAYRQMASEKLSIKDVMQRNTTFAGVLINLCFERPELFQDASGLTIPHHIGPREFINHKNEQLRWGEWEYLTFWLMVIMRLDPELSQDFSHALFYDAGVNHQVFNDHTQDRKKRAEEYEMMHLKTLNLAHQHQGAIKPVDMILRLPDSELSLGSGLEQNTARELGVQILETVLNSKKLENHDIANDPVYRYLLDNNLLLIDNEQKHSVSLREHVA